MFTVAKLTLREAVKVFHVSRPTLQKALKSGKVSGVQDGKGVWQVDPSELARVYQSRAAEVAKTEGVQVDKFPTVNRALPSNSDAEVQALKAALEVEQAKREAAEALADERGRHIEDLRRMLPPPGAPAPAPRRRRWWPW